MRVFVGFDITDKIRQRIAAYMENARILAPDAKWVRPETFHVTLKFIGEQPPDAVERIKAAISEVKASPLEISFRDYGFFPSSNAPRVFWIGIHAGDELKQIAAAVDSATSSLGVPRETHAYSPHLTLARSGSGAPRGSAKDKPSATLRELNQKLSSLGSADFGSMECRSFFLYQSHLSAQGAKYTKLAAFPLR